MKKLQTVQIQTRDQLVTAIRQKQAAVEAAVQAFNEAQAAAWESVTAAVDDYNGAVADAESFRAEIDEAQAAYYDDRSDNWKEGESGLEYDSWHDQWTAEFEPIEIDAPAEIEDPEIDHADRLAEMPDACE